MSVAKEFDVIVVGAGPGGEACAGDLGEAGKRVAIVERERVGGECAFWACAPSKILLRSEEPYAHSTRVPGSREAVTGKPSFAHAAAWRTESVSAYDDSEHVPFLRDRGVRLFRGTAEVKQRGGVLIDGESYACGTIVIATGSEPSIPKIDGLDRDRCWTSREATAAGDVPRRLAILGAGAVGMELGQVFARYGSQVTIIDAQPQAVPTEEPGAAKTLTEALQADGVEFRLGTKARRVDMSGPELTIGLERGDPVKADKLLIASGRVGRLGWVDARALGLKVHASSIVVDQQCRAAEGVFAVGDVTGVAMFTHVAKYQGHVAAAAILGKEARASYDAVPRAVFTDPELGAVGKTAAQAREANIDCAVAETPLTSAARANLYFEKPVAGSIVLVADKARKVLVGASITSPMATEMLGMASTAIKSQTPIATLLDLVQPFPTFSEAFLEALRALKL